MSQGHVESLQAKDLITAVSAMDTAAVPTARFLVDERLLRLFEGRLLASPDIVPPTAKMVALSTMRRRCTQKAY